MKTFEEQIREAMAILAKGGRLVVAKNVTDALPPALYPQAWWPQGIRILVSPHLPPGTIVAIAPPPAIADRQIANAGDLLEKLVAQGRASVEAEIDRVVLAGIEAADREDAAAAGKAKDVTPCTSRHRAGVLCPYCLDTPTAADLPSPEAMFGVAARAMLTEARASVALDGQTQSCHDWSTGPLCRMCKKTQFGTDPGEACPGSPPRKHEPVKAKIGPDLCKHCRTRIFDGPCPGKPPPWLAP